MVCKRSHQWRALLAHPTLAVSQTTLVVTAQRRRSFHLDAASSLASSNRTTTTRAVFITSGLTRRSAPISCVMESFSLRTINFQHIRETENNFLVPLYNFYTLHRSSVTFTGAEDETTIIDLVAGIRLRCNLWPRYRLGFTVEWMSLPPGGCLLAVASRMARLQSSSGRQVDRKHSVGKCLSPVRV